MYQRRILVLFAILILAACPAEAPPTEHPCELAKNCVYDAAAGESNCKTGYTWEDPSDANNYNCILIDDGSCTPTTCAAQNANCGTLPDGCEGTLDCGTCPAGQTCGAAGANQCGEGQCVPTTCAAQNAECGNISDGCGNLLDCGNCPVGETCGQEVANQCSAPPCEPTTCAAQNAECGSISDGCGSTLNCGTCPAGEICGGDGPNQCGTEPCVPTTCAAQNAECGTVSDGCDSTLNCGTCASSEVCTDQYVCEIPDADNDGVPDASDDCPNGESGWTSSSSTDGDGDGCQDSSEDTDDDNDGVLDSNDCDSQNPNVGDSSNDADCDGVPTAEDCNDNDANKPRKDFDCDGVLDVGNGSVWQNEWLPSSNLRYKGFIAKDMDGDGDADLTFFDTASDRVICFEQTAQNQLIARVVLDVGNNDLESLRLEDVDGDADPDVIYISDSTTDSSKDAVFWAENKGQMDFSVPQMLIDDGIYGLASFGGSISLDIRPSDLDGDGDLDFVLQASRFNSDSKLRWYENDGLENFQFHALDTDDETQDLGWVPFDAVVDIDNDGHKDIITSTAWYLNDGAQNFIKQITAPAWASQYTRAFHDMDGDGDLDVVTSSREYDGSAQVERLRVYENDGNQNYSAHLIYQSGRWLNGMDTGDIDGDGDMDIVVGDRYNSSSAVTGFKNEGALTFTTYEVSGSYGDGDKVQLVDADADGDLDVISARYDGIAWMEQQSDESFVRYKWLSWGERYDGFLSEDMDADGDVDFFRYGGGLVYSQMLAPHVWAEQSLTLPDVVPSVRTMTSVDLDSDGDKDLLVGFFKQVAWYENTSNGQFEMHQIFGSPFFMNGVVAIDVDSDGDHDVISFGYYEMILHRNNGSGVFEAEDLASDYVEPRSLETADMDGDGDVDMVFVADDAHSLKWMKNEGDAVFTFHDIAVSGEDQWKATVVDLDSDGDHDILCPTSWGADQVWFENDGAANFTQHVLLSEGPTGYPQAADMDNDGDIDLVYAAPTPQWCANDGSQNFGNCTSIYTYEAESLFILDADSDGDTDLLTSREDSPLLLLHLNTNDVCPFVADPEQTDTDNDHYGDMCDAVPENANYH